MVVIEDAVFLRSPIYGECGGGDVTDSFAVDVLRDSQENGPVSFRGGGAGAGRFVDAGGAGGGDQGIDGSFPERPCSPDKVDLEGIEGLPLSGANTQIH